MALPTPNVSLYTSKSGGRTGVKVAGVTVSGVVSVTLEKGVIERTRPDGWVERQPDGQEYVNIKVMRRFVTFEDNGQ
jgi:hypothetical protein